MIRATTLPAVLTIAGSDSSGGAGIQADLKTMLANGVYGMSAITSLTAQNTTGVNAVADADPSMLAAQIDAVYADIPPAAVKIGMVSNVGLIRAIADRLAAHQARNVVLDPVMVATSGARLIDGSAVSALVSLLFPLATVITPNIPESETLARWDPGSITSDEDMRRCGNVLAATHGCAVLIKGGHRVSDASDVLVTPDGTATWFRGRRIDTSDTHGTGCTLSSAIASNLAKGSDLPDAIREAKEYLSGALAAGLSLGHGSGPMDHAWRWRDGDSANGPRGANGND
ncbi:bifunctional hydroxymethylpyrimidine kinase/phosphomethylpyrimidine kinase [uncultured Bifidobacterium sp.]|uniref:bifunctional hydroxymethylpyrimidine kinase/phosphomethylpyrimidine kinase n=1 Tax=uncultured Bifidobacterium sp. TaxID=165187 RepID=UPI00262C4242|nr:bifunctional hydroxymethylpyrimidine kinase/phosphomethylpyrimidine kinase [uncultured Bifidobacterium sp.]